MEKHVKEIQSMLLRIVHFNPTINIENEREKFKGASLG